MANDDMPQQDMPKNQGQDDQPTSSRRPSPLQWVSEEPSQEGKGADWYWLVGLITVSLVVSSFFFGNILLGILLGVGGGALILQSLRTPKKESVVVSDKGIKVGNEYYPYRSLTSFWVETELEDQPKLLLHSQKTFMPLVAIPVDESKIDPEDLADYLLDYIDEEELVEPLPQKLMEWMGF